MTPLVGLWWVRWGSYFRGKHTETQYHLMADTWTTTCGRAFPFPMTVPKFVPMDGKHCTRCLGAAIAKATAER